MIIFIRLFQRFILSQAMQIKIAPLKILAVSVIVVVGCATIPTQEMSDARQAIQAAREVQAEYYAPGSLAIAEQNLTQAERHLEEKAYEQARLVAVLAKRQALNSYNMARSLDRAKQIWQAISELGDSTLVGRRLLEKAYLAAKQNHIDNTIEWANKAYYEGEIVLNQARLKVVQKLIEQLKQRKNQLSPEERIILHSAQQAYLEKKGNQAYRLIAPLRSQLP
jgi:hypothetical protein